MRLRDERGAVLAVVAAIACGLPAWAQGPPSFAPAELERLVSPIALYPDSLLTEVLAAATFPDQIPDAARWADEHHYLRGDELARAIDGDRLPWDPSVQALLPFPSVLERMASDLNWTSDLGNAFLAEQPEVMDAVQRMRHRAWDYGYLRTSPEVIVRDGPFIEIVPADPAFICVPAYDPVIVYARPRPGFVVGGAIHFGFGVTIGAAFRPWGWGVNRFAWNSHTVIVNNAPWRRTWANRPTYVHPYEVRRYAPERRVESHELHERSAPEREAARNGRERVEEHGRGRGEERRR
ncbi:MAG: DUF3300 domain-containing protein [Acidobacteriia bacterium]|nr:DUF3300 domain-containing protein [Terriglobia bacterium]